MRKMNLVISCVIMIVFSVQAQVDHCRKLVSCEWDYKNIEEIKNFECIGKAIGERSFVFLGEQSHGDGESFKSKIELIKYLQVYKGFDVVLFESDIFALNQDLVSNILEIPNDSAMLGIYNVWTDCFNFLNYFGGITNSKDSNKNIEISGFDSRVEMPFSQNHLLNFIDTSLNALGVNGFKDSLKLILKDLDPVSDLRLIASDSINYIHLHDYLTSKLLLLNSINQNESYLFLVVQNLIVNLEWKGLSKMEMNSSDLRDVQMASNLFWLLKYKYKNQKCIIWTANYHAAKLSYLTPFREHSKTMIEALSSYEFFENKTYTIGFTSLYGKYSYNGKIIDIPKKRKDAFEKTINKNVNYAFFDNINQKLDSIPFNASFIGHFSQLGNWRKIFDGFFYIRNMKTCDSITEKN